MGRSNKRRSTGRKKHKNRKKAKMKFALMEESYGPLKKGKSYEVLHEGKDYFKVKRNGKPMYVSKEFVDPDPFAYLISNEPREREQEIVFDENFIFQ